ncbi:Maf family protein [Aliagarivorans taiwanensis]|uniref:Maf family protein n=1 Tax=Aliagarivorans taiwanensis TaxID=561966 RepID=UPI0004085C57|nr:Maf family protein [Aliagarivorans taiwanensis]
MNKQNKPKIVLASSSPFRKQILAKVVSNFDCFSPDIDESPLQNETAKQLVERLAIEKAKAGSDKFDDALIIGSDQVCVIDEEILGKPGDHQGAIAQLSKASGKTVRFYTGLALHNSRTQSTTSTVEIFDVKFRELNPALIECYLQSEQPYNCAGSFKSEGSGIVLFDALLGDDPNTLIGLPLIRLVSWLEKEGVALPC